MLLPCRMKMKVYLIDQDDCLYCQRIWRGRIGLNHASAEIHGQAQHCFVAITELINLEFLPLVGDQESIRGCARIADVGQKTGDTSTYSFQLW